MNSARRPPGGLENGNLPAVDFYDKKINSPRNEYLTVCVPSPRGFVPRTVLSNIFIAEAELI